MNHHARYGLLLRLLAVVGGAVLLPARAASAQAVLPPLPDSTGWGVHVLTAARDSADIGSPCVPVVTSTTRSGPWCATAWSGRT